MECLLFLWWNFALYLACYDRTCYLDETLHCNMYMDGTCLCMNNVYGWNLLMYEQCVWMKLMWYVIWNLCAGYVIWNLCAGYVIYICCENCWSKKPKKRQYAGSRRCFPPRCLCGIVMCQLSQWRQTVTVVHLKAQCMHQVSNNLIHQKSLNL